MGLTARGLLEGNSGTSWKIKTLTVIKKSTKCISAVVKLAIHGISARLERAGREEVATAVAFP